MIYLRQKSKGPPLPGTWVLNKDSPQARGLLGWWVAGGSNLLVPDHSGRKVHAAGEAGTSAVVNDFGPAVRTQKTTTGAIDGGGFRLPTGITEYSALIDTVPVTLNSDNRYGAMGQVQTEGAPNNEYDWIGCYLGSTFTFNFFPIFGSSITSTSTAAAGRRIHWMGAYKSGVRTNQYINGKLDGTSAAISGAMTSIADFAIGRGWTSGTLTFPMQFREARIYNRFITEAEAADWYGKNRWDLYYELGRRTIYLPATGGGTVVGAGGSLHPIGIGAVGLARGLSAIEYGSPT